MFHKYKKGGYTVRKVVQDPTFIHTCVKLILLWLSLLAVAYTDELIKETVTLCSKGSTPSSTEPTSQPPSLGTGFEKPSPQ